MTLPNFKTERSYGNSEKHLALIRQLPSCLSGRKPCDPHHLLSVPGERGIGQRATDRWTVPLTRDEHEMMHRECTSTTEEEWFGERGIMPHALARELWNANGNLDAMERIVARHSLCLVNED